MAKYHFFDRFQSSKISSLLSDEPILGIKN